MDGRISPGLESDISSMIQKRTMRGFGTLPARRIDAEFKV